LARPPSPGAAGSVGRADLLGGQPTILAITACGGSGFMVG
jgi:hypothetical protein